MINLEDVLSLLKKEINLKQNSEFINISEALGRVLFDDVYAKKDLPCFDNSALDGYAVKFNEKENGYILIDTIFAGDKRELSIKDNECIKIMTGAKFPKGADTVIRFEDSYEKDGKIFANNIKQGDAHRFRGEEVTRGTVLIKKDTKLEPTHIMLLAAQGITQICVKSMPRIAIFSSGDEIKEPWEYASDDEIYNANAFGISSLLLKNGFKSSYLGIIKDDLEKTIQSISDTDNFDVIITSGGASQGEADYMKQALFSLGFKEVFDHIKIRPGAPTKAYTKENKVVFILPGNPMAAYIMTLLVVVPFLNSKEPDIIKATLNESIKLKTGRVNVVLGNMDNGQFNITGSNKYGSGMITPLTNSNAIYLSNKDENGILAGSEIFVVKIS